MGMPCGRLKDFQTGESCYPPTECVSKIAPSVLVNGYPTMVQGSQFVDHACDIRKHTPFVKFGSLTVFIEGKQCARIGDPTTCGGKVMTGSGNVLVGG